ADEQRAELLSHRDHDCKPYVRERCAALLQIAGGQAPYAVARTGLFKNRDPDSVYPWLDHYQNEGLPGQLDQRDGAAGAGAERSAPSPLPQNKQGLVATSLLLDYASERYCFRC